MCFKTKQVALITTKKSKCYQQSPLENFTRSLPLKIKRFTIPF